MTYLRTLIGGPRKRHLSDARNMTMNLNYLVPNVRIDACIRIFSLLDGKCDLERVARRNGDFVGKEVYTETIVHYRR